jgi:hypothetical protein
VASSALSWRRFNRPGLSATFFIDDLLPFARSLRYEFESAFSTTFKRVMDCSPRQYGGRRENGFPFV